MNVVTGFDYNVSMRCFRLMIVLALAGMAFAQAPPVEKVPVDKSAAPPRVNTTEPPRQEEPLGYGESSSKQTEIDISAPDNDATAHPHSAEVDSDIGEFHAWDPHKAAKAIEVGDFYYKKENYRAAISRYQEALQWKPNDAEATYKLAQTYEKSGDVTQATENYRAYLKILPHGPFAEQSQKALDRLKQKQPGDTAKAAPKPS